jgi:hypothetical protein
MFVAGVAASATAQEPPSYVVWNVVSLNGLTRGRPYFVPARA